MLEEATILSDSTPAGLAPTPVPPDDPGRS